MPANGATIEDLRRKLYDLERAAQEWERLLAEAPTPEAGKNALEQLTATQQAVQQAQNDLAAAQKQADVAAQPAAPDKDVGTATRSLATTLLQVNAQLQMPQVPTAYYHLLNADEHPLVRCTVTTRAAVKRVRISSYIEGYSAQAVDTVEVRNGQKESPVVAQQPTLFLDKVRGVNELTRASLNLLAEDLDTGKVEIHETMPVWLLARNSAPLATYDPATGTWQDMSRYLGAFVTPNHPSVMAFLRRVADKSSDLRLVGYQGNVDDQARALFAALKEDAKIVYVNSLNDFNPDSMARSQRVRLPRQVLEERQANCVDGALLFASLLEAMTISPALVVLPQHVIVAWETAAGNGEWRYLDTTKLDTRTFDEAAEFGEALATAGQRQQQATGNDGWFRLWPLRKLRADYKIYPAE